MSHAAFSAGIDYSPLVPPTPVLKMVMMENQFGSKTLLLVTLLLVNSIAGISAGTIAAILTCPFDVIKTRMQLSQQSRGTFSLFRSVVREEAASGLFRGVGPRAARVAPSCAIVLASYEILKKALTNDT